MPTVGGLDKLVIQKNTRHSCEYIETFIEFTILYKLAYLPSYMILKATFNDRNVPKITWLNIFFKWLGMNKKHDEEKMFDELIKMYLYHLHV